MDFKQIVFIAICIACLNSMVTSMRTNNMNKTRLKQKSTIYQYKKPSNRFKSRALTTLTNTNINQNLFSKSDLNLVETFIQHLRTLRGDWSKNGIQRLIRLNSQCSSKYVSLRNLNIKADIPIYEAFKDPYTLIEQQIYRKLVALKSKFTNKYLCYNYVTRNFVLKSLNNIDKYCIFFYSVKSQNKYSFAIGTNKTIHLSFNKFGSLIDDISQARICQNRSIVFNLHTKSTDNLQDSTSYNMKHIRNHLHEKQSNDIYLNLGRSDNKRSMRSRTIKSKKNSTTVNITLKFTTTTKEYKIYLMKSNYKPNSVKSYLEHKQKIRNREFQNNNRIGNI